MNSNKLSFFYAIISAVTSYFTYVRGVTKKVDIDKKTASRLGLITATITGIVSYLIFNTILTSLEIDRTKKEIDNLNNFLQNHPFNKKPVEGVTFVSDEEAKEYKKELDSRLKAMAEEATEIVED